jgi:lipoprotein-releasing system permease protein
MGFEWKVALRYLTAKRSQMVSLITMVSVIGVALGVMLLIVVLSVMGGFAADLREKIVATKAHVVISPERGYLDNSQQILNILDETPEVLGASPYVESEVMISTASSVDGVVLRGIDLDRISQTSNLWESIQNGDLNWLSEPELAINELSLPPLYRGMGLPVNRPDEVNHLHEEDEDRSEHLEPIAIPIVSVQGDEENVEPPFSNAEFIMPSLPGQNGDNLDNPEQVHIEGMGFSDNIIRTVSSRRQEQAALPGVVIGTELAQRLHVGVGSELTIISPDGQLLPSGPAPLSRPFLVVGTFYTGMYEFDTRFVYVLLDEARSLLRIPGNKISAIDLRIEELDEARGLAVELFQSLSEAGYGTVLVRSWEELNKSLFAALKLEKAAIFIILMIIILVASFSIVSNLIVMVVERAGEIAILKSMGASNRSIMRLFGIQGTLIGLAGTTLGVLIGIAICLFIERVGIPLDTDVYYIEYLPIDMRPVEVIWTALAAMMISFLATIYPALKAARLSPADGLRYE